MLPDTKGDTAGTASLSATVWPREPAGVARRDDGRVVCLQERRANDVGVEPAAGLGALRWSEHAPVTVEYG